MATLQTLDRGIRALEIVSRTRDGISVAGLADSLGVDRAIAYRIVATLEARDLVSRNTRGQIFIGGGVIALASGLKPQLSAIVFPHLQELAGQTNATAYLSIAQGDDCVVTLVADPKGSLFRVGYRVGSRHPLDQGAAGIAILAGRTESDDDLPAVRQARENGFAVTRGQLQVGAVGVAAPVLSSRDAVFHFESCVGVVAMSDLDIDRATTASIASARQIAIEIGQ